jgi:hypothetical protein
MIKITLKKNLPITVDVGASWLTTVMPIHKFASIGLEMVKRLSRLRTQLIHKSFAMIKISSVGMGARLRIGKSLGTFALFRRLEVFRFVLKNNKSRSTTFTRRKILSAIKA